MSMYVPEPKVPADAQGNRSSQPQQTHSGTGTDPRRTAIWSQRSIEQKVHDALLDSVNDAGAIDVLRSEGVADPQAALARYRFQRAVRVDVRPYDRKRSRYLAALRVRRDITEGMVWERSDIKGSLKKEDLWETLRSHYGLDDYGLITYRWDRDVLAALDRFLDDPSRIPAELAGPTSAKPLTADDAAAIRQREQLARDRAALAELGAIITESFLGALSYGQRSLVTDDPHDLLQSARLGAIAEGAIGAFGAAMQNRGTYLPRVEGPGQYGNPHGTWRYSGPAATKPSGPVSPRLAAADQPTAEVVKPAPPSELRRKAESGARMLDRAEKRLVDAATDSQAAGERVTAAEERVRLAQAEIDARQQSSKSPTKAQQLSLQRARNELARAEAKQAGATAGLETARTRVDAARQLAETRAKAHQEAAAAAAWRSEKRSVQEQLEKIWNDARPEVWKAHAQAEIDARKAGTSKAPLSEAEYDAQLEALAAKARSPIDEHGRIVWPGKDIGGPRLPPGAAQQLDPIKGMTDAELALVAKDGRLPPRWKGGAELEHSRIPQRVGTWLAKAGIPSDKAAALTNRTDPGNLDPASPGWHATVDEYRAKFNKGHDPNDPMSSLDTRVGRPLEGATDKDLADILAAVKQHGANLDLPVTLGNTKTTLRDVLRKEMARRPAFKGQAL